nr:salivary glue protein Sgs-3-like [Penaeus vannamei]
MLHHIARFKPHNTRASTPFLEPHHKPTNTTTNDPLGNHTTSQPTPPTQHTLRYTTQTQKCTLTSSQATTEVANKSQNETSHPHPAHHTYTTISTRSKQPTRTQPQLKCNTWLQNYTYTAYTTNKHITTTTSEAH